MDLEKQLQDGANVFDIFDNPKLRFGFYIFTYRLENESEESWHERDERNFQHALKIKGYGRGERFSLAM